MLVLDEFLPYRLSVAANAVSQVIARSYDGASGLKTNEWRMIAVLAQDGPSSQQRLANRTKMDKVAVSRAATSLADRGFVSREQDPGDARSLIISLTEEGRRAYGRLAPLALALEQELRMEISAKEVETLHSLLRRLEKAAERILGPGAP
ncbi:MAG TPA: MarR family transcriptional regulator [Vulgatibacter sp.]